MCICIKSGLPPSNHQIPIAIYPNGALLFFPSRSLLVPALFNMHSFEPAFSCCSTQIGSSSRTPTAFSYASFCFPFPMRKPRRHQLNERVVQVFHNYIDQSEFLRSHSRETWWCAYADFLTSTGAYRSKARLVFLSLLVQRVHLSFSAVPSLWNCPPPLHLMSAS